MTLPSNPNHSTEPNEYRCSICGSGQSFLSFEPTLHIILYSKSLSCNVVFYEPIELYADNW
jgi:hypothetical protein